MLLPSHKSLHEGLLFIKRVLPDIQGATVEIYGYSVARVYETILHSSSPQRAVYHAALFLGSYLPTVQS